MGGVVVQKETNTEPVQEAVDKEIKLYANADCWIGVTVDDGKRQSRLLKKEEA